MKSLQKSKSSKAQIQIDLFICKNDLNPFPQSWSGLIFGLVWSGLLIAEYEQTVMYVAKTSNSQPSRLVWKGLDISDLIGHLHWDITCGTFF